MQTSFNTVALSPGPFVGSGVMLLMAPVPRYEGRTNAVIEKRGRPVRFGES